MLDSLMQALQGMKPRVLVAEENARLRRIVCLNLNRAGLKTAEVASLAACQVSLLGGDFGLVIISADLPGFEIERFSQWLRDAFPDSPVPVVILSFEPEHRLLTLPLRVAAFQQKPFDPGKLADELTSLMQTA